MVTSLEFDVGLHHPEPVLPDRAAERLRHVRVPVDPLGTTTGSIGMTGAGATFDLGAVQAQQHPTDGRRRAGPYVGERREPDHFDGSGSSSICGFPTLRWDFSDGGVAFGKFPQHTFTDNGTYSGLLTATDPTGLSSTTTFSVVVNNVAPSVNAGPGHDSRLGPPGRVQRPGHRSGSSDQSTLQYSWDFGDGSPSASGGPERDPLLRRTRGLQRRR